MLSMKNLKSPPSYVFHLLPNAHLDPVWLWDWQEGLNEGVTTVRTVLDLMDEFPKLTFIRGESSIYEHIEKTDSATFERVGRMIESGRWDVVGGTYNQPDTNLAATETLCRQYERGLAYFDSRFKKTPRVSWQADSFGHTPGLPNIMRSFGMTGFAFTRPARGQFPMPEPAFWWECDHSSRVLCYRQHYVAYCSERGNIGTILDHTLKEASDLPLVNVGVLMGLGNHGGGPSRRHIADAEAWGAAHPNVEIRYSTLHGFFADLENEIRTRKEIHVPRLRGDMGFCLRGCYSSVMKFKSVYRRAEALLASAEATQAMIATSLDKPHQSLGEAWDGILFNSFHDILPGSSIERAFDEQLALAGLSAHQARKARFDALNQLALQVDTSVPPATEPDRPTDVPLLVWNPLPREFRGWVEMEAPLDYRPLKGYTTALNTLPLSLTGPNGEKTAFQEIATEHGSMRDAAWRKRLAVHTSIPPLGWKVFRLGYRDKAQKIAKPGKDACVVTRGKNPSIRNRDWKLQVTPAGLMKIGYAGRNFLGGPGTMKLQVVEDIWGSWGGMEEEKKSIQLEKVIESWAIRDHEILEEGPGRASLWTRWKGRNSWLELTYQIGRDAREVRVKGRLLWNERSARLKLVLPSTGPLTMQVPGSEAARNQSGHLPCGRWFRRGIGETSIGFISDVLSDVDTTATEINVTLARATRYANDVPTPADVEKWLSATDCGELKFEFWLAPGSANLTHLAQELIEPPVVVSTSAHPGTLPDTGSLARLEPDHLALLAARVGEDGNLVVRVQNLSKKATNARLIFGDRSFPLGILYAFEIKTVRVETAAGKKHINGNSNGRFEKKPALVASPRKSRTGAIFQTA